MQTSAKAKNYLNLQAHPLAMSGEMSQYMVEPTAETLLFMYTLLYTEVLLHRLNCKKQYGSL